MIASTSASPSRRSQTSSPSSARCDLAGGNPRGADALDDHVVLRHAPLHPAPQRCPDSLAEIGRRVGAARTIHGGIVMLYQALYQTPYRPLHPTLGAGDDIAGRRDRVAVGGGRER